MTAYMVMNLIERLILLVFLSSIKFETYEGYTYEKYQQLCSTR